MDATTLPSGFGKRNDIFANVLSTSAASESSGGYLEDLQEDDIWGTNDFLSNDDPAVQDGSDDVKPVNSKGYESKSATKVYPNVSRKGSTAGWAIPSTPLTTRRPSMRQSAPVNIPDWSKISGPQKLEEKFDADDDSGPMVPPHEILAKEYASSMAFSVYNGVGRTLRGRDLSSVRTAVLRQTGFLDS